MVAFTELLSAHELLQPLSQRHSDPEVWSTAIQYSLQRLVEKSFERENLKQQQSQFVLGDKTGSNSWHYCCQCYPDLSRWWNHFISYYLGHTGWATHFLNTVFIFEIVSVSRVELGLTAFTLFLLSRPTNVLFILKVLLKRFWVLDKNTRFGALFNPKKWLLERVWKYARGQLWRTTQLNLFWLNSHQTILGEHIRTRKYL